MNDVRIEFGTPEHGWMELTIGNGSEVITLDISDVPCNSVYKLADIVLNLQAGSQIEEVEFSLEPDFALWRFVSIGGELQIHVFPNSSRNNPVIFKGVREKLLHHLYKALRDLESLPCWQDPDVTRSIWSWEFPSKALNKYRAKSKNA